MTIREQSKLSIIEYAFRITLPGALSILSASFKDAIPFFFNLLFVPIMPIMIFIGAINARKRDRELVVKSDLIRDGRKV